MWQNGKIHKVSIIIDHLHLVNKSVSLLDTLNQTAYEVLTLNDDKTVE